MLKTVLISLFVLTLPVLGTLQQQALDEVECQSPDGQARYLRAYQATLDLWPVVYELVDVPTRFGNTRVIASGSADAPPLVLLHAASASATMWFPNAAAFTERHRIYAVDVLGDTLTSRASPPPQVKADYADWIADVFDGLGVDAAPIVGSSYGGWVTMNAALFAPERVEELVLLSPANAANRCSSSSLRRMLRTLLIGPSICVEMLV